MAEKGTTIIIKRIKKGGHGHHGGAWKVAYADFVTAMMAFFMVMWLLGSDEETKAAVSHYFNNPTSAWRRDQAIKETMPIGDMTGLGQNVVSGANGQTPDDLVSRPVRPLKQSDIEGQTAGDIIEQFLSDSSLGSLDQIRFSIPESKLFKDGTTNRWSSEGEKTLEKLSALLTKYRGKVEIKGTFDKREADSPTGSYEFQLARSASLAKHIIDKKWAREENVTTAVSPSEKIKRVEFTLTRDHEQN
jgi:chemotaxis protein MotB